MINKSGNFVMVKVKTLTQLDKTTKVCLQQTVVVANCSSGQEPKISQMQSMKNCVGSLSNTLHDRIWTVFCLLIIQVPTHILNITEKLGRQYLFSLISTLLKFAFLRKKFAQFSQILFCAQNRKCYLRSNSLLQILICLM